MAGDPQVVIIGAGPTGWAAANSLRSEGHGGPIHLVGNEPYLPYDRTTVSKQLLTGETTVDSAALSPEEWYRDNDIDLRLATRVVEVDPTKRRVALSDGDDLAYDALLLATGGEPRRLRCPGHDLAGIHYVRTAADSRRILDEAGSATRAVVVGAGFIGSEVAASLTTRGLEVTVVEALRSPLSHVLGEHLGEAITRLHRDHGTRVVCGEPVAAFEGGDRVEAVRGESARYPADLVVVGVGIAPRVELAERAGAEVDDGVVVDQSCRTSVEGVFAAGDIARHPNPLLGLRLRVEHYDNALAQGAVAGAAMAGLDRRHAEVPWFWSDQYDVTVQYAGHASGWERTVMRGAITDGRWSAFFLSGGRLLAAVGWNSSREVQAARRLMAASRPVDPETLADPSVDLRRVARGGSM